MKIEFNWYKNESFYLFPTVIIYEEEHGIGITFVWLKLFLTLY